MSSRMIASLLILIFIALFLKYSLHWRGIDLSYIYNGEPKFLGHRGDRLNYPENTIVSYRSAIEKGLHGVEIDIMMTQDGHVVCSHNFDLERETTGSGYINDIDLLDFSQVRAGKGFPKEEQQPIPQLLEVIEMLPKSCILNIEIKTSSTFNLKTAITVAKLIQDGKIPQKVIISSFNPLVLRVIKFIDRTIPTGFIYNKQKNFKGVFIARPDCLHPKKTMLDKSIIEFCKKRKMYLNVWTVNNVDEVQKLLKDQVDGIITDIPEMINNN